MKRFVDGSLRQMQTVTIVVSHMDPTVEKSLNNQVERLIYLPKFTKFLH